MNKFKIVVPGHPETSDLNFKNRIEAEAHIPNYQSQGQSRKGVAMSMEGNMNNTNSDDKDDEKDWLGYICDTAEQCPIAGYWEQIETGDVIWHETADRFPELESTPSSYKRAQYKYLGKTRG